ncbi:hypothetical protein Hsw_3955 [Hymenobacter swuensis DY53]|uniref:Uncharacterized protein n=1 Tax=Hymenobacter swuensis DY53 TaxID=1227739 RepID=W8FCY4_9BACT|nr:hypothetical protein Hsw_3955 [Hymenobacter swuensis DY53]
MKWGVSDLVSGRLGKDTTCHPERSEGPYPVRTHRVIVTQT